MKQTAVEWLKEIYDSCNTYEKFIANIDWEQAKEMEKEQIIDAYEIGAEDWCDGFYKADISAEQYYNECIKIKLKKKQSV
jgi:hypothetical protein